MEKSGHFQQIVEKAFDNKYRSNVTHYENFRHVLYVAAEHAARDFVNKNISIKLT